MATFTGTLAAWYVAGHKLIDTELKTWFDALKALTDPLTTFAPVWGATVTAPVLNNGAITAKYQQVGKGHVRYAGKITIGSTTTLGSGFWTVTLPVPALDVTEIGSALAFHTSAPGSSRSGVCQFRSTTLLQFWADAPDKFSSTSPFAWLVGDTVQWDITYEAA